MKMVGHETKSIYQRYAIQDEAMLAQGSATLDAWTVEQKTKAKAEKKGQLKRFARGR